VGVCSRTERPPRPSSSGPLRAMTVRCGRGETASSPCSTSPRATCPCSPAPCVAAVAHLAHPRGSARTSPAVACWSATSCCRATSSPSSSHVAPWSRPWVTDWLAWKCSSIHRVMGSRRSPTRPGRSLGSAWETVRSLQITGPRVVRVGLRHDVDYSVMVMDPRVAIAPALIPALGRASGAVSVHTLRVAD